MSEQDHGAGRLPGGGGPRSARSDSERRDEERLGALLGTLELDVRAPRALREAVMREIAATPRSPLRRAVDWCIRPRTLRLSPAWGGLAVAAAAALVFLWPEAPAPVGPPAAGDVSPVVTRFVLVAPEASSVHLTGDFASWLPRAVELRDLRGSGIWTADVALEPGVYQYTFVIDGTEWRADPRALSQVDDGFGQVNSVIIVSGEGEA